MTKKLLMLICLLFLTTSAFAVPNLQLYIPDGTFDTVTETWETSSDAFRSETSSKYYSNWSTSESDEDCDYEHDGEDNHDGNHEHDGENDHDGYNDHYGENDHDGYNEHDYDREHSDDCDDDEDSHPSAVPEPATMLLFGLGMVGAGISRKFRSKK